MDVCIQGQHWASICYNEDVKLAGTVCKMLGFPIEGIIMHTIRWMKSTYICIRYTGAMAQSTNSSIVPKVDCTVTNDGTKLICSKDTVKMLATSDMASLVIKCQTHNYAVQNTTSALGAVIGLLILLEVGTVIAWVACTVTRKRLSCSPKQRYSILLYTSC